MLQDIMQQTEKVFCEGRISRKGAIYLSHMYGGKGLQEIGGLFGLSESGVCQASRWFAKVLEEDKALQEKVQKVKEAAGLSIM
jgi:chromosomal replication initiation ATPase DnaA